MPRVAKSCTHSGWVSKLWFALECRDQRAVSTLIRQGANINHVFKEAGHGRHGMSPIFIAIHKNSREMVNMLLTAGCDIEQEDAQGETPFFCALRRGKLMMVKEFVKANCHINHVNCKGENAIFLAIRWGRKDIFDYLLTLGVHLDVVSREGNTPLLLAMELYEHAHSSRHVTRRSAPSNMLEIMMSLVPKSSCLNHHHPNKGSALRIALNIEAAQSPHDLKLTKLLLQHGAIPDRLFFLRYGGLLASQSQPGTAEFFTPSFFNLAIAAGAILQRERTWLQTVLQEMPEELQPHQHLFLELLSKCVSPLSLEVLSVRAVRNALGGKLWMKIDRLPIPVSLKESMKLKI